MSRSAAAGFFLSNLSATLKYAYGALLYPFSSEKGRIVLDNARADMERLLVNAERRHDAEMAFSPVRIK